MADTNLISMKLVSKDGRAAQLQGEIAVDVDARLFVLMAHDALRMAESKGVTTAELRVAKETLLAHLSTWGLNSPQIHLPSNGHFRG